MVAAIIGGYTKTTNNIIRSNGDSTSGNSPDDKTAECRTAFFLTRVRSVMVLFNPIANSSCSARVRCSARRTENPGSVTHQSLLSAHRGSMGLHYFVGITDSGIFTATDGATWTMRFSNSSLRLCALTGGGNRFVAVSTTRAISYTAYAFVSPDGITGSAGAIGLGTPAVIAWGDSQFTAVGNGVAYTSTHGGTTVLGFSITGLTASDRNSSIAYGANLFTSVGDRSEQHEDRSLHFT